MSGLLCFDGGSVDLATHEVWAICEAVNCTHKSCLGKYAATLTDGEPREVFRVRNRRDLLKHLSVMGEQDEDGNLLFDEHGKLIHALDATGKPQYNYNASTRVLIVPKRDPRTGARYLETPRPSAAQVEGREELPPLEGEPSLVKAIGTISANQAKSIARFPIDVPQALAVIEEMSAATTKPMLVLDNEVLTRRNRGALEQLVRRFGYHHVRTMTESARSIGVRGAQPSAGLAIDIAGKQLHDREGKGRFRRASYRTRSTDAVTLLPTAQLKELNPRIGEPVTGRLRVELTENGHPGYRFFYRGLQQLPADDVDRVLRGLSPTAETMQKARNVQQNLPELLQELVDEGVFASSATEFPVDKKRTNNVRALGSVPSMRHDRVVLTCPHPTEASMVLLLIGKVGSKRRETGSSEVSYAFEPITVIAEMRDNELMEEIADIRPTGEPPTSMPRKGGSREGRHYSIPELAKVGDLSDQEAERVALALGFGRSS